MIHIGKCGGGTINTLLTINKIKCESIHTTKPIFDPNTKYIIAIRNPIKRFISAFWWRYKLVVTTNKQSNRFLGERDTLLHYNSPNTLAEQISKFNINTTYIHHIKEDIDFYLGDFLKNCKKENIFGVITTENLDEDFKNLFGVTTVNVREKQNAYNSKLSELGYANLKNYLHKDYECIDKLYELGCLSEIQYTVLSK